MKRLIKKSNTREYTPIALFVYNRLWHTKQTIAALQKNILALDSDLIIFSDGPKKSQRSGEEVLAVREYLKTVGGFRSVKIIERASNYGLARSIIEGVTEVIDEYGSIIVLEDDLETSKYFLKYMNEALCLYENNQEVISISGYAYSLNKKMPNTYFLPGADCWGWATWKRGWDLFESDGKILLERLKTEELIDKFNFNCKDKYTGMLKDQIEKKNDSWAIRWLASSILFNKITLYPGTTLVKNIGFDGSGTHCESLKLEDNEIGNFPIFLKKIQPKENREALKDLEEHFNSSNRSAYSSIKKILVNFFKQSQSE